MSPIQHMSMEREEGLSNALKGFEAKPSYS